MWKIIGGSGMLSPIKTLAFLDGWEKISFENFGLLLLISIDNTDISGPKFRFNIKQFAYISNNKLDPFLNKSWEIVT